MTHLTDADSMTSFLQTKSQIRDLVLKGAGHRTWWCQATPDVQSELVFLTRQLQHSIITVGDRSI